MYYIYSFTDATIFRTPAPVNFSWCVRTRYYRDGEIFPLTLTDVMKKMGKYTEKGFREIQKRNSEKQSNFLAPIVLNSTDLFHKMNCGGSRRITNRLDKFFIACLPAEADLAFVSQLSIKIMINDN